MSRCLFALLLPGIVVGQDLFLMANVPESSSVISSVDFLNNQSMPNSPVLNSSIIDPFSAAVAFKFVMAAVHGEMAFHVHGVTAQAFFQGAAHYTKGQFVDALMDMVDEKLAEAAGMEADTYKRLKDLFFLKSVFTDVMTGAWGKLYDDCRERLDEVTNDHIVEGLSEYLNHMTETAASQAIEQAQTCLYSMSQLMCNYDPDAYNKYNTMCSGYRQTCSLTGCCHVPGRDPRSEVGGNHALYVACCD